MGFFSNIGFGSFLPIIGNGIDALVGHYESNRQMHFQEDSMREQMAWQEKMNAQQQEWQEGMWNKTNEYNTPSAQLGRMVAAGINPNNAAMQVAGGSNNAQMAQQPQTPSAPGGLNGAMPSPTNFGQAAKDAALIESEIQLKKDQGQAALMQGEAALRNAGVNEGNLELNKKQLNQFIDESNARINQISKGIELTDEQINMLKEQKVYQQLKNGEQKYYNENILPLVKEQNWEQIKVLQSQWKKNNADVQAAFQSISESRKRMQVMDEQIKNLKAERNKIGAETEGQEKDNQLKDLMLKREGLVNDLKEQERKIQKWLGPAWSADMPLWNLPSAIVETLCYWGLNMWQGIGEMLDFTIDGIKGFFNDNTGTPSMRYSSPSYTGSYGSHVNPRF